jgi:streptogramin lyase
VRLRLVFGAALVVAAIIVAGVVSSPGSVRPCVTEVSKGIHGNPTHVISSPDGNLYAAEEPQGQILKFNPDTHQTQEYKVGVQPHDLTVGPDGRVWFLSATQDAFGALDPRTGQVTRFQGITKGAEPHMLRWLPDGRLYITEAKAGGLAVFDPRTQQVRENAFGLPQGNYIHNIAVLPNGDFWAVLQEGDALAHFNLAAQRFDKIVPIPVKGGGPRDIAYVPRRNKLFATLFAANKFVEYDLKTGKLAVHPSHFDAISYATAQRDVSVGRASGGRTRTSPKLAFVRPDAGGEAIWIATLSGGELLRYNPDTGKTTRVGCGLSFPAGPLGITNDGKGRLWMTESFPIGRLALVHIK